MTGVTGGFDPGLVDAFLAHHLAFRPVDATFMGIEGHDDRLPPAAVGTEAEERAGLDALQDRLAAQPEPSSPGDRLDLRLMRSEIAIARASLEQRPRFANPAWYTGEAAFAVIGLLLPQSQPTRAAAVAARLAALPDFLADGRARLSSAATPRGWVDRAQREAAAVAGFLRGDIRLHPGWSEAWAAPAESAARALDDFSAALAGLPDRDPACGEAYLALLMREAHGLALSPAEGARRAQDAFDRMGGELEEMAARIDPVRSWQQQVEALSAIHPAAPEEVPARYRHWHDAAVRAAQGLVTSAAEYGLSYRPLAPEFRTVARDLYFLFYRSPPAARPADGSVYWVTPPGGEAAAYLRGQNDALVKAVHAVHHGSIGHHTQNARARRAASRLARLGGTDCAAGIAFLSAGTMVEGWACYAEDLLLEAPGFYTPGEVLLLKQFERRNAASVLVDIRLHTGEWTLEEAKRFYRDEAGFAAARVDGEVTRNSIFPGTRLMYWLGVEAIKDLRSRWHGGTQAFHDTLLGHGHVPVAWAEDEMRRAGQIAG